MSFVSEFVVRIKSIWRRAKRAIIIYYCVAKNATHRTARSDPSLRKERLLRMTNQAQTIVCHFQADFIVSLRLSASHVHRSQGWVMSRVRCRRAACQGVANPDECVQSRKVFAQAEPGRGALGSEAKAIIWAPNYLAFCDVPSAPTLKRALVCCSELGSQTALKKTELKNESFAGSSGPYR